MNLIQRIISQVRWKLAHTTEAVNKEYARRGVSFGEHCELQKGIVFGSEPYLISIGDNVRINPGVIFSTHDGGVWVLRNIENMKNADVFGPIKIGNNVHIGNNAVILPGVCIGDNVVVAVGAVVTKDVPSNSIVAGVPARVIESYDEYLGKVRQKCVFTKGMTVEEKKDYLMRIYSERKN